MGMKSIILIKVNHFRAGLLFFLFSLMITAFGSLPARLVYASEKMSSAAYADEQLIAGDPALELSFPLPETKLPSYYNWADEGKKPVVRKQDGLNTCWALCAVQAIESGLLPENYLFSAEHMTLKNGYTISQNDGGDYYMVMSYLADWKGPVREEEDPYGDGISPDGLQAAVHVQQMRLLAGMDHEMIRQMILEYGPVQSSLSMNKERTDGDEYHYYNAETCAYHDPMVEKVSHDVLVLGWDDAYSRDNFRIMPRSDGAWICLNSWGEEFGRGGIFYVSYEDANLFRNGGIAYGKAEKADNYDFVRENDSLGWLGRQGYGSSECYMASVFSAKENEILQAAGFYCTAPGSSYRLSLIPDFEGEESLKSDGILLAWGTMAVPGYYTLDFSRELELEPGKRYALKVWLHTPDNGKPMAVELKKDEYTEDVIFSGRETYISKDGSFWENTQEKYQTNVCLKAYGAWK